MAYEWSAVEVPAPTAMAFVDVTAVKPWGQSGEEAFQLNGRVQVFDMSGNRDALAELGAVKDALTAAGWEQITFTTVQEITRTVIETV
ncbi:hypothetical protein O3S80_03805 [Streptomyces sp. Lzd4kr]|nr:hypothetical protein [Streptomyces sp. Lzd4kr]